MAFVFAVSLDLLAWNAQRQIVSLCSTGQSPLKAVLSKVNTGPFLSPKMFLGIILLNKCVHQNGHQAHRDRPSYHLYALST